MPLNIDWQQILLHALNFVILVGGLYFLLFNPVKKFMAKREEYCRGMEEKAEQTLREAEQLKADYASQLETADAEIDRRRAEAQRALDASRSFRTPTRRPTAPVRKFLLIPRRN